MKKVIVGGASGFIGQHLVRHLQTAGWEVIGLSRKARKDQNINFFQWDVDQQTIDPAAFEGAIAVINLAGAGIVDKAWTTTRKEQIISSRVDSNALLAKQIVDNPTIETFISASAVGIYGDTQIEVDESSTINPGGFLVESTHVWETSFFELAVGNTRKVAVRVGLVLGKEGGAYPPLIFPLKFGVAAYFRPGSQYFPWIHIDDLCRIFMRALENKTIEGPINGVGPLATDAKSFMQTAKKTLRPWAMTIGVPTWLATLLLGERSAVLTQGANVVPTAMLTSGFSFRYSNLPEALKDLGF